MQSQVWWRVVEYINFFKTKLSRHPYFLNSYPTSPSLNVPVIKTRVRSKVQSWKNKISTYHFNILWLIIFQKKNNSKLIFHSSFHDYSHFFLTLDNLLAFRKYRSTHIENIKEIKAYVSVAFKLSLINDSSHSGEKE